VTLQREPGGYRLCLPPDGVDLHCFRQLVTTAGREGVPAADRARLLTQALSQWRGTALIGLPGEWAASMRDAWDQERLQATVAWARAKTVVGKPEDTLGPLSELAAEHPLAESVIAELLRALAVTGRGADALDRYGKLRRRLIEELGTEPGPELQAVHSELLHGQLPVRSTGAGTVRPTAWAEREPHDDPDDASQRLYADSHGAAPTGRPPYVPKQLPAPPRLFTGRAMELADLDQIRDASAVVITAIDGMAGVGKTALAVRAAHQMLDRYPDGQLFIDLHGYTNGVAPIEPGKALNRMLRTLGVPGERIPTDLDERAGLYRSRLADQRMLIVLDNAATEAQVTPLLPGAPGCLVLVTSRRRLAGLDHSHTVSLDTLPLHDAVALFQHSVSDSTLAGRPPELLAQVVELCGQLPLAIRIAAARLRSHPAWDLERLVRRLHDQLHRLVELAAGQLSITAALDLSYQDLNADQRRSYRLLGLQPDPDIDLYAAAALLHSTLLQTAQMLEQLLEAHLLQEPVPGRYQFHDLTRAHASDTATRDETEDGGRIALDRLLDYYCHTASIAMDAAYPYERERRPQVLPASTPDPALSDPAAALGWLDNELPNLLAATRHANAHDRPAHLLHLSAALHRHLRSHGHYQDAVSLHQQALTTARATGQEAAEVEALNGLGHIHRLQSRPEQATRYYQQALRLARATGRKVAEMEALNGFGHVHLMQGRYEQAKDHYERLLDLAHQSGDHTGELNALVGLGHAHRLHGRHDQAPTSTSRRCSSPAPPGTAPARWMHWPASVTSIACRAGTCRPPTTTSRSYRSPAQPATEPPSRPRWLAWVTSTEDRAGTKRPPTTTNDCSTSAAKAAITTGSSQHGRASADCITPPATWTTHSPTTARPSRSPPNWATQPTRPALTTGWLAPTTRCTNMSRPTITLSMRRIGPMICGRGLGGLGQSLAVTVLAEPAAHVQQAGGRLLASLAMPIANCRPCGSPYR
jgi:tetratricopeptide (TPR) repeat protein